MHPFLSSVKAETMLLPFLITVKTFSSSDLCLDTRYFHIVGVGITRVVLSPVTKYINQNLKLRQDIKSLDHLKKIVFSTN